MANSFKTISSKVVHSARFWDVLTDQVKLPDGQQRDWNLLRHKHDFAIIIAKASENTLYLVSQFRYAAKKQSLEFSMGYLDDGETALDAAKRELKEETGLSAKNWQEIGTFSLAPGLTNQQAHVFLATNIVKGSDKQEDSEFLQISTATIDEIRAKIAAGEIHDGPTICAFYFFTQTNH